MQKIILFYIFTPVQDPEAIMLWQRSLAQGLNLRGRVIISKDGINATLGGDIDDLKSYIKETKEYPPFKSIVFKWSEGVREDFPRLSVKVRPELVAFNIADQLKVTPKGITGGGKRVKPEKLHDMVSKKGKQLVFVDGRNAREAAIGRFKDALVFDVNHTRDFTKEISKTKYRNLKDKTLVTYCTGGIRCEVLSKLMIDAGYADVYQLDGGIVSYLDKYGDDGLWEGSLYVFDRRLKIRASDHTKTIGQCSLCGGATDNYVNCANKSCNELILACSKCIERTDVCASCLQVRKRLIADDQLSPANKVQ